MGCCRQELRLRSTSMSDGSNCSAQSASKRCMECIRHEWARSQHSDLLASGFRFTNLPKFALKSPGSLELIVANHSLHKISFSFSKFISFRLIYLISIYFIPFLDIIQIWLWNSGFSVSGACLPIHAAHLFFVWLCSLTYRVWLW